MAQVIENDYSYREAFSSLAWALDNKIKTLDEKGQLDFIDTFKKFLYNTIHVTLYNQGTKESESETRQFVKYIIGKILPFTKSKITKYMNIRRDLMTQTDWTYLDSWLNLDDDFKALASYRSLMHLAMYLETQDEEINKVWKFNLDKAMGGVFYYSQQMILNHNYQNMLKQCPPGYGKSKSDCVIVCYILGYDINGSIMKVIGNRSLVDDIFTKVVNMLKSEKFGKVFPQFGKYNGSDDMFRYCKATEGKFTLKDSKAGSSFALFNKQTAIDGTRYNYQFYDDVTQSNDKNNINAHMKDRSMYEAQWSQRCLDTNTVLRWFTGTAYHREDFLSYIRKDLANGKEWCVDMNIIDKFKWARYCKITADGKSVRCLVPGLADLELGEDKCFSTFPERFTKDYFLKKKHGGVNASKDMIRDFWSMIQQEPAPGDALPFDWSCLNQYDTLPKEIFDNNCDCMAIIDPSKRGRDYYACLIFKSVDNERWYLTDCYYRKTTSLMAIPVICQKLSRHKVKTIWYEWNATDEELFEKEIKENMKTCEYNDYSLESIYSTKNKEEKIYSASDEIKRTIIFPRKGLYNSNSEMGLCMSDIVNYNIEDPRKNAHDDSIDCCAMLVVANGTNLDNSIEILDI